MVISLTLMTFLLSVKRFTSEKIHLIRLVMDRAPHMTRSQNPRYPAPDNTQHVIRVPDINLAENITDIRSLEQTCDKIFITES